jgi:hypothetical protein
MSLHKEYHKIDGKEIKMSIFFEYNYYRTDKVQKGYTVSCVPVQRNGIFEEIGAFTGFKMCILPSERQGKRKLQHAIELLHKKQEEFLNYFK